MAVNLLNRSGPISFSSITLNSEKSSINSLLSSFTNPGSDNFSLSSSMAALQQRVGNADSDTKTNDIQNALGAGIINNDFKNPIKFSEFYGASFLSASINLNPDNDGTCTVLIYSPSTVVNNNFLTGNTSDQVFQYTLYSKNGTTTPFVDSGWTKIYSYAKSGDNNEIFYNLINTKTYKVVAKDCLSNSFTSSIFIGTCNNSNTYKNSYSYNISSTNLSFAINNLKKQIIADTPINGYSNTQVSDIDSITNNLEKLIINPASFRPINSIYPELAIKDVYGYSRTLRFDGLILQKRITQTGALGYFLNGLVTATSVAGSSSPTQQYSFENTSTLGQINFYILGSQTSTGTSCASAPTNPANLPTNISFAGPTCGDLECGTNKPQSICNPSSVSQIKHTGSFSITNNNADIMTVSISDQWLTLDDSAPDALLKPITVNPTSFTIPAKSFKKVAVGFGLNSFSDPNQPSNFTLKTTAQLNLPITYTPNSTTCQIIASFDKNKCIISTKPPDNVPDTDTIGCVTYKGGVNESCNSIKSNLITRINSGTGTASEKQLAVYLINALPCTGCDLPTQIETPSYLVYSFDGYVPGVYKPTKQGASIVNNLFIYLKGTTFRYELNAPEAPPLPRNSVFSNGGIPTNGIPLKLGSDIIIYPRKTTPEVFVTILEQPAVTNNYTAKVQTARYLPTTDQKTVRFTLTANDYVYFTWTLVTDGNQPYVCDDTKFSGTYDVVVTNSVLGTSKFRIEFLRNNNNSSGLNYIKLCRY